MFQSHIHSHQTLAARRQEADSTELKNERLGTQRAEVRFYTVKQRGLVTQSTNIYQVPTRHRHCCRYQKYRTKQDRKMCLCQASVGSSVLSPHSKDSERRTRKASARHSSRVLETPPYRSLTNQGYSSFLFRR